MESSSGSVCFFCFFLLNWVSESHLSVTTPSVPVFGVFDKTLHLSSRNWAPNSRDSRFRHCICIAELDLPPPPPPPPVPKPGRFNNNTLDLDSIHRRT